MNRLVKFELIKLFHSVSFYICGVMAIFMGLMSVGAMLLYDTFMYGNVVSLTRLGYSGLRIMFTMISVSDFPLLIGIIISIGICIEYSGKTFKNVWARGFSRTSVFAAKAIAYSIAALCYGAVLMLIGFIFGTIFWGVGQGQFLTTLLTILVELLACIAYALLFVMVAFAVKKTALAVVIAVACPSLISLGATIIDYILEAKKINFSVGTYLLTTNLSYLSVPNPEARYLAMTFLVSIGYIATALVFGVLSMRKDEI